MRLLDIVASVPIFSVFVLGANVVSEGTDVADTSTVPITQTGSTLPFLALALLFAFTISGLIIIALETRREEKDKQKHDKN